MRSPVTLVIQSFNALTEDEKKLCLDFIAPEPEPQPEAAIKKTRKKRTTRSAHQESISAAIAKTPKAESETGSTTLDADTPKCGICGNVPDHSDHDPTYLSSHEFEVPKSASSAPRRSSRKGVVTNSTVNSETTAASAAVAAGGSSE